MPKSRAAFLAAAVCLTAAAEGADFSGLKEYPLDLVRGVREEVRPEGLLTLLAAGGGASVARYGKTTLFDDFKTARALQQERPLGRRATDAGGYVGYPVHLMTAMGATYLIGTYLDASDAQEFGLLGFEALSLAGVQTLILKFSVKRLRPDETDLRAFPSGHTSASFALATVAASRWGWKTGVPACLAAGFIGYTRMESNNHYLSDVFFGAGLGIASGRAAYKARYGLHPDRYALIPFVSGDGGGVTLLF